MTVGQPPLVGSLLAKLATNGASTSTPFILGTGGLAVVTGIVGAYLLFTGQSDEPETLSAIPFSNPFSVEF